MNLIFISLLILLIIFLVAFFIYQNFQKRKEKDEFLSQIFLGLRDDLEKIRQTLDFKLNESSTQLTSQLNLIHHQFTESFRIVQEVTEHLTRIQETNKQVMNFAEQLRSLQDILKNPKQRGILGEYFLETVLSNVLPPGTYEKQYSFSDGTIVDAVIKIDKKLIPIDSKFSLENYNRILEAKSLEEKERYETAFAHDLKTRIDETAKYIKPEENTMDFAFMFIPSEAVFYDLLVNKVGVIEARDLIEYAFSKKVIIVSPTSFLAYLQTVLQGLKNQKISEEAQKIIKEVERLGRHLKGYEEYMVKLGKSLETTVNHYNRAYKELSKVDKDILKISGTTAGITPLMIESSQEVQINEEELE